MGIRGSDPVRCERCRLHVDLCLCSEMPQLEVATSVVVFIHAHEQPRPSNTGSLAVAMLAGARMVVVGAKGVPLRDVPSPGRRRLLLHPDGRALTAADGAAPVELLIADGTWHQARHMSQRVAPLRATERVSVASPPGGRRRLRRDGRADHLSTIEALAHALGVLGETEAERSLLRVYGLFVERTLARRYKASRDVAMGGGAK